MSLKLDVTARKALTEFFDRYGLVAYDSENLEAPDFLLAFLWLRGLKVVPVE